MKEKKFYNEEQPKYSSIHIDLDEIIPKTPVITSSYSPIPALKERAEFTQSEIENLFVKEEKRELRNMYQAIKQSTINAEM